MKFVERNFYNIAAGLLAMAVGMNAATALGQDTEKIGKDLEKLKDLAKIERGYNKGFCESNNWSNGDRVSSSDLREIKLASTGSINVDGGKNGGVRVVGENRSDVLVRACVQSWAKTDAEARSMTESIKINTGGTIKADGPSESNWSVSYELHVPRNTDLNLSAHNGGISISGVDGTAEFETMNGGVRLSDVAGSFKGRTTNGGVSIRLIGSSWKGSGLDVTTTNGGVNIEMPENYAAHVETGTVNGGFKSSIPALNVTTEDVKGDWSSHSRSKRISMNINGGGPTIKVITTNGGVRIGGAEKGDMD